MTSTAAASQQSPNGSNPTFVVARTWNNHGPQDYLAGWDSKHGTVCTARSRAMVFQTKQGAHDASTRAKRIVPTLMTGTPITYTVLPA